MYITFYIFFQNSGAKIDPNISAIQYFEIFCLFFQSSGAREIKPGMRLEALDRKTPNLICVATVGMY